MDIKEAIEKVWQEHPAYLTKERFELAARDLLELLNPNHGLKSGEIGIRIPDVKTEGEAETLIFGLIHTLLETIEKFPDADISINQCRKLHALVNRKDWADAYYHSISGNGFSMQYASCSATDYLYGENLPPQLQRLADDRLHRQVAPLYQGPWQTVDWPVKSRITKGSEDGQE